MGIRGWLGARSAPRNSPSRRRCSRRCCSGPARRACSGPLVNLAAIPLVGLAIVPLCLIGAGCLLFSESLAGWLFGLAEWLLLGLLAGLDAAARAGTEYALVEPPVLAATGLLLLAMASLLLLLPRGFPGRRIAGLLALPLLFAAPPTPRKELLQLDVLDVGQGLAVLVQDPAPCIAL